MPIKFKLKILSLLARFIQTLTVLVIFLLFVYLLTGALPGILLFGLALALSYLGRIVDPQWRDPPRFYGKR